MPFAMLSPRVLAEMAIAAVLAWAGWWAWHAFTGHYIEQGRAEVQVKWDAVEKERAEALAASALRALQITKDLQASADKQRGDANAQIAVLNRNLGTALDGLRNRPERPGAGGAVVPGAAASGAGGTGCTGAQLYRADGEFLTREAARADRLAVELGACYRQYNDARAKVN